MPRRSAVLLVLALASPYLAAQSEPRLEFSGELLIALEADEEDLRPVELGETPLPFVPLFQTRSATGEPPEPGDVTATADVPRKRTWVLARPPVSPEAEAEEAVTMHPWDIAHRALHGKAPQQYNAIIDALRQRNLPIGELEPSVAHRMPRLADEAERRATPPALCQPPTDPSVVHLCMPPSVYWPSVARLAWHHEDPYTQLGAAQREAERFFPPPDSPKLVTVAHLDTGYDKAADVSRPPRLDLQRSHTFIPEDTGDCGLPSIPRPGCDRFNGISAGHGPSTLSILAGGKVKFRFPGYPEFDGYLGGAPLARVIASRVSNSVILIWPKHVADAIAEMAGTADVISMSMGGAPSGALRDAVNDAYESGTAMFFATGDFVRVPLPILDIHSPRTLVYPARFSRTTPVAGITADTTSYGVGPSWLALLRHRFRNTFSWMLRGSYGPTRHMQYALTGYTPNISRHHASKDGVKGLVDMSFSGTSAATPQAAAAAALWLQVHRDDFDDTTWRSWKKSEAVYSALLETAHRDFRGYKTEFFGGGVIRAKDALAKPVSSNLTPRPPAKIGFDWITLIAAIIGPDPNDEMDEERQRLHEQMLRTEVAQLVATSASLQDLVDPEETPRADQLARIERELKRHPGASAYLRRALEAK